MSDSDMKSASEDASDNTENDEQGIMHEFQRNCDGVSLGLSLGDWGSRTSPEPARRTLRQRDLQVGSSSSSEKLPVIGTGKSSLEMRQQPGFSLPSLYEHLMSSGMISGELELDSGGDTDPEMDMDHDSLHKRPKVLSFVKERQYLSTSFLGHEESMSIATEQETSYPGNTGNAELKMDLSDDLLHLIFSFLDHKDLCTAGATCKQWLAASAHEEFWRSLNFENTGISKQNLISICHRYPNVRQLNISGVPNADSLAQEAMASLRRLEMLTLGKGQLTEIFRALTNCHALTVLNIYDASLGNGGHEVSIQNDRLRDLQMVKCRTLRVCIRCPQLQTLSLKRSTLVHVVLYCPELKELDLASCHKLSDTAIRQAATTCPMLTSLDMSACSCVSDETLRDIAYFCPNLSVLDASNCPNITFEAVRLPMLVDLKLHSCEGITSASVVAIASSRALQVLQLDNCSLLTSVSLDLPLLRNISLVHLRKCVDLNLRSPVLSFVKVSRCSSLSRINITSSTLQKLVLQKQESLALLSLQCPNLTEVDLSDCESLKNSICEVFSDGGGCPMLKSLFLDNCESLDVVELDSSSLVSLSLAGCRSMNLLRLSCPNLQIVNLDCCDHLEKATFSKVGLESLNLGICPKLRVLHIEAPKMSILELKGCGVLEEASINCPHLVSLDASFCRQFSDDSLSTVADRCPLLEHLILSSCLSVGIDGLSALRRLRRLTLLDLSYTFLINLRPVFETSSQLKILKLSACKFLSDKSLDSIYLKGALPTLEELDLSYSPVGQDTIMKLLASCPNLVQLDLNGCANLQELVWTSTSDSSAGMPVKTILPNAVEAGVEMAQKDPAHLLEVLNCIGCPNIRKVLISSAAQCMHLQKLNLNLSANLKEVDLTCFNLVSLNLSNCSFLAILKLDCPRLANLQLACSLLPEQLESAISRCSMLETLTIQLCPKVCTDDFERLQTVCPSLKRIQCTTAGQ